MQVAREAGAAAIESWPTTDPDRLSGNAFLGRQKVFELLEFTELDRPVPNRVLMRLGLKHD